MSLIPNRPSSFPICLKDYNQIYNANEQKYQRPYVCKRQRKCSHWLCWDVFKNPQKISEDKARECLETCFANTHFCTRVHAHTTRDTRTLLRKGWRIQFRAGRDMDANVEWLR